MEGNHSKRANNWQENAHILHKLWQTKSVLIGTTWLDDKFYHKFGLNMNDKYKF